MLKKRKKEKRKKKNSGIPKWILNLIEEAWKNNSN